MSTNVYHILAIVLCAFASCSAFAALDRSLARPKVVLFSTNGETAAQSPSLDDLKSKLIATCSYQPSLSEVETCIRNLEEKAEEVGIGQCTASSGLMNGEWELLYASDDVTRSSPFFWAFRQAFPDQSDQIFGITDAIPSPIKDVGPAIQKFEIEEGQSTGKFTSQVQVATLGGQATSLMTTQATIIGSPGINDLELQVETTQPKESTIVKRLLGPLSDIVNGSLPAFPSGQALEQVAPGSSKVTIRTSFCDDTLRISRNVAKMDDVFVWQKRSPGSPSAFEP